MDILIPLVPKGAFIYDVLTEWGKGVKIHAKFTDKYYINFVDVIYGIPRGPCVHNYITNFFPSFKTYSLSYQITGGST